MDIDNSKVSAYLIMGILHENWGPVAVFLDKAQAQKAAEVLNFRLTGKKSDDKHPLERYFSVHRVDFAPKLADTGNKFVHVIRGETAEDEDDDILTFEEAVFDYEYIEIEEPIGLYQVATFPERDDPYFERIIMLGEDDFED